MRGKYIILEGGEGGGKTTQQKNIVEHLKANGIDAIATKEPGGTSGAEALRAVVLHKLHQLDPFSQLLIMYAARRDHLTKVVEPALREGKWVVSDRGWPSSYAYQGTNVQEAFIDYLQEAVVPDQLWGDVIYHLRVRPLTGLARAHRRNFEERNELTAFDDRELEYHLQVLERYDSLAREVGWITIDANQDADVVKQEILATIRIEK